MLIFAISKQDSNHLANDIELHNIRNRQIELCFNWLNGSVFEL